MLVIKENLENASKIAASALKNSQIICFATETVYALACDATNDSAVKKLYEIKKRDLKKPISVFVKNLQAAKEFLDLNYIEDKIAQNFMPGMITLVLNKKTPTKHPVSLLLNDNENTLGLRIPDHKFCLEMLKDFNGIAVVTSANISNEIDVTTCEQVIKYFDKKVDLIVDGGMCKNKISSTVLKVDNGQINILRQGIITKKQILDSL